MPLVLLIDWAPAGEKAKETSANKALHLSRLLRLRKAVGAGID